jgi:hypothetical protein
MRPRPVATYEVLRALTLGVGGVVRVLTTASNTIREGTIGVVGASLSREERAALGISLYEAQLGRHRSAIPSWEASWLEEDLPRPPAHVLVGAAGQGRECRLLAARGYRVTAFEPGPIAAERCRAVVGDRGTVVMTTYEAVSAAALDGATDPEAARVARDRYDAVLFGWTSIMHILGDRERARVFLACDRLCPVGPILATFYPPELARPGGRARATGTKLGQTVARLRGGVDTPAADESFTFGGGFLKGFSEAELDNAAAAIGRTVHVRGNDEGCRRVTLLK